LSIHSKEAVLVAMLAAIVVSVQGCDQIQKFSNYLSPKNSSSKTAVAQQSSDKTVPVKSAAADKVSEAQKPAETGPEVKALPDNVLAKVGEWTLTMDEFNARVDAVKTMLPDIDPTNIEQRKYMLGELIQQQLLAQEALARKLDQKKEFKEAMMDFRNSLLVQMLGADIGEVDDVTDEEARLFYDENPDAFKTRVTRKIREIVVATEDEAKAILVELNQGASFAETAKTKSVAKTAAMGGFLGSLSEATGDPNLDKNVFPFEKMAQVAAAMDPDSVSGAFKGPEGVYIIKVEEVTGGDVQAFNDINKELKQYLQGMKQQQILIETLAAAQEKFPVNINEKLLEE